MVMADNTTLVIIPTFNERENLPLISDRLMKAVPEADLLVVDDNSPDGTGDVADELAAANPRIHAVHRTAKEGLLAAYVEGFTWGLDRGYTVICQMDADGSHAPEDLPKLLHEIENGADLVIGSRYVPGGKVVNWPKNRYILSKGGNLYIGLMLGGGLTDMTAGFRAFKREVLEALNFDELSSAGYIFQTDIARRCLRMGFDVREVPITFTERELGESKLDGSFVGDSLKVVTAWGLKHRGKQALNAASQLAAKAADALSSVSSRIKE
ncbi:dolichol-phosphate mannosyltransferase [Corynebacterium glucuronolyticum]|nr:Undecaprenyl-phosphate mannosyltransferase [Corynebacterium glucuronolyticum DSM 44120]SMB80005.1 dolichol-phosphate mannosyltransferase [Corynebacterium glucuronolyticum]